MMEMVDGLLVFVSFMIGLWCDNTKVRRLAYDTLFRITKNPRFDKRTNIDIFREEINGASRNRTGRDHFPDY